MAALNGSMTPLVSFPIDLTRTAAALESITAQLSRITAALERLSPPLPEGGTPYRAGLSDLRRTDPESVSKVKDELRLFAENNNIVLDSESFVRGIIEYERQLASYYGAEALNELPWNKAAGGLLFESYLDPGRQQPGRQQREGAAHTQGG